MAKSKKAKRSTHKFEVTYPRGTWPVYRCTVCYGQWCPTAQEMGRSDPPAWWTSECKEPDPLTRDDLQWLTGTGRYGQ